MDREKLIEWSIAGACSVALHAIIITLFILLGKSPSEPAPQPAPVAAAEEKSPAPSLSEAPPEAAATTTPPAPMTPPATTAPMAPPAPSEPRTRTYKVKPGDNLTRLARNAGTTPAELARLNGVDEKELAKLKVGQTIKLPSAD